MKTAVNAAARAQGVDTRVADSPFVGLRYHTDVWAADLDQMAAAVDAELAAVKAERAGVLQALRDSEGLRRHVLNALRRYSPHDVVRCFHDSLSLTSEIGRLDERAERLQRRVNSVAASRAAVAAIREALRTVAASGGVNVDPRATRLTQASRHLLELVDEQHETTAEAFLEGPMQRLSDAAFDAEVMTRLLDEDMSSAAEHARRCRLAVADASQGIEELIRWLRPVSPDRSLTEALRDMLRESPARDVARVRVLGAERRLPLMQELTVYRVVEEAVDNAVRHGRSHRVDVVLSYHGERLGVVVKDDGDGFDVAATEARLGRTSGRGLIEMHGRAALNGSRLEVRSLIGAGTEVRMMLAQRR